MVTTTCREAHNLLELFFDSELDPRQMRAVAIHSATCPNCEEELRQLEHLQDAVARSLNERVEDIDLGRIWTGIEHRLQPRKISWGQHLQTWWSEREWGWGIPALGAAAAAGAFAAFLFWQTPVGKTLEVALENPVSVHEISSDSHIALIGEADSLMLWVDHELGDAPIDATAEPVNFDDFK